MELTPIFTLADRTRVRIRHALKRAQRPNGKPDKTINILGCSFAQLKSHIEKQFKDGMTWKKVLSGEIHLDHKIPISHFDLTDNSQLMRAFNFKNLQPLWASENLSKSNKILPEFALELDGQTN